jgi:hypothetical protein
MSTRDRRRPLLVILAVAALLAVAVPAPAALGAATSTVRDWNAAAVTALANAPGAAVPGAGQTPPVSILHLAMVQGAVYDAAVGVEGGYQPYLGGLTPAPGASLDAAVATAAHHVLVGLSPALAEPVRTRLDGMYADSLAAVADGTAKSEGIAVGAAAASSMLDARANDGRFGPFRFTPGTEPGQWRPTGSGNDPFAWVAKVEPFLVPDVDQFASDGPHAMTSAAYAEEFNEVKAMGSASSVARTPAQTDLARFYTANPVVMWNATFRTIAQDEGLTQADEARLFAMLNMTTADAVISCWEDKARWSFWRPSTAIAEAANDGNPATTAEAGWTPLVPNPPYPDHPSGYNCVTSSFFSAAQNFFGSNKMEFDAVSNAPLVVDRTRHYVRFSDVWKDTIDARVYLGIHFRTPDVAAVVIGKKVATWVARHHFQPTD